MKSEDKVPMWWAALIRRLYGPKIEPATVLRFWSELDPAARTETAWARV
jgi:hypothetical protein